MRKIGTIERMSEAFLYNPAKILAYSCKLGVIIVVIDDRTLGLELAGLEMHMIHHINLNRHRFETRCVCEESFMPVAIK